MAGIESDVPYHPRFNDDFSRTPQTGAVECPSIPQNELRGSHRIPETRVYQICLDRLRTGTELD